MRLIYIFILFGFFGFSQTNEVIINQAMQQAEAQNITTPSEAVQALEASGMTETQARQLAAQRGLSYDQLMNDYFSTENTDLEENSDSDDSDDSDDSEEEQEEEQEEEEKEEEKEEEEEEEEESEEESEEEEEEEEKEKKKKNTNPIIISANLMRMSGLDGAANQVIGLGFAQSSMNGEYNYSANMMVWDNLKQISLSGSRGHTFHRYDKKVPVIIKEDGKEYVFGHYYDKGSIANVQTLSAGLMYMYGVYNASFGISNVYIGQKENKWKGFVGGISASANVLYSQSDWNIMPAFIFFGTKPFPFKRFTVSPMLATALTPVSYSTLDNGFVFNEHALFVGGANFDFSITKTFRMNLGFNVAKSTDSFPLTYSITIGGKFKL